MKETGGRHHGQTPATELSMLMVCKARRWGKVFFYGFALAFLGFTALLVFDGSSSPAFPKSATSALSSFHDLFSSAAASTAPYGCRISSFFYSFFPNSTSPALPVRSLPVHPANGRQFIIRGEGGNETKLRGGFPGKERAMAKGKRGDGRRFRSEGNASPFKNQTVVVAATATAMGRSAGENVTRIGKGSMNKTVSSDGKLPADGPKNHISNSTEKDTSEVNGVAARNRSGDLIASRGQTSMARELDSRGNQSKGDTTSTKNQDAAAKGKAAPAKSEAPAVVALDRKAASGISEKFGSKNTNNGTVIAVETGKSAVKSDEKKHSDHVESSIRNGGTGENPSALLPPPAKTSNLSVSLSKEPTSNGNDWIKSLIGCDLFDGKWVKDDNYPLYPEGSCPHIDEPFNCYLNGRPDRAYQNLRWQPHGCTIPRFNASDMLERLRGKRLVFVGDSLNRNMWESLVCALRHAIKDKNKVFEASGREEFRTKGSYSFLYTDYNCSVEFFRSPFLVQEWEVPVSNGKTKETLRLDIIERSSPKYRNADVIVFNTGHWWTHEKTSRGRDYYQEGTHIYSELNVSDAFHKALNTWAKWVDNNVDPKKSTLFFRGYSASHFSGGQWNSGGQCDKEVDPIKNENYLSSYPPKMTILEEVIRGMRTPVVYLNITRMTDYRKDAHPSIYRKQNLSEEERRSPERYQDCSHWCLPGVPDSWNELLYAHLLIKQHQLQHHK